MQDVIIIGAGIVGSLIARKFSSFNCSCLVIEKENDVGNETSNANSAIIHSGYDPVPGSLKAKYNVLGNKMYDQLSKELDVSFERIGSLTLATKNDDSDILNSLFERSKINGVEAKILSRDETKKMEPLINDDVIGSLYCPSCGIIDPFNMVAHAMENACDNSVELHLNEKVIGFVNHDDYITVITNKEKYDARVVVNSAGVFSCKIAQMFNPKFPYSVTPRKGEYFVIDNDISLVNHVCFPAPSALGKGILVSKTTSNNFIIGPNNVLGNELDDKSTDQASLGEIKQKALKCFSALPFRKSIRIFSGIRPHVDNLDDFYVNYDETTNRFINLIAIESPGFASAPAIAEDVIKMALKVVNLEKKTSFNPYIKKYVHLKNLSIEEKNNVIKKNSDYGTIVCLCESVSLGEIKDVLSRSIPVTSIKGIKKRTRAGFGRCQGGFCQPKIATLISKTYNIPLNDVLYDTDSKILEELAK